MCGAGGATARWRHCRGHARPHALSRTHPLAPRGLTPCPPLPQRCLTPLTPSPQRGEGERKALFEPPVRFFDDDSVPALRYVPHMRRITYAVKRAVARQLRRKPTPAERHAWALLKNRGVFGLKFRRQHLLGGFIVDFYCPALRLVLELDGAPHDDPRQASYDAARTAWLEACGYRVCRVRNRELSREGLEQLLRPLLPQQKGWR